MKLRRYVFQAIAKGAIVFWPGFIYCAYFSLVVFQAGKPENKYSISIIRKHESER